MSKLKSDLSDTTFIIPVRIDSIDRLENLLHITNYLLKYFKTSIYVLEIDSRNNNILKKLLNTKIIYEFHIDPDIIFYRTKYINYMVNNVKTPIIAIWDTDVISKPEQIQASISHLRNNNASFVYPYSGTMLNIPNCVKNIYLKSSKISILDKFSSGFDSMYGNAIGGAFFANRLKYIESGMENENFYGWGLEDGERFQRWKRLNYIIKQVEGVLYHLDHKRGSNSIFHNKKQKFIKMREKFRISNITDEMLKDEISKWRNSNC